MKKFTLKIVIISIFLTSVSALGSADILHVPGNYPTIQDAIDAAINGDTVLVAPGTYVETIDFKGKAITVRSSNGADVTTINGNQSGSVVSFKNYEGQNSILEGFTLRNGNGSYDGLGRSGGAVLCFYTSPIIRNNIMTYNSVDNNGAGVLCWIASPTVEGNVFSNNSSGNNGGGLYCVTGSPVIRNNTFSGNYANQAGASIYLYESDPLIAGNTFTNNTGIWAGGIAAFYYCAPTITSNTFYNNVVDNYGGAIYCWASDDSVIKNNLMYSNTATGYGGGGIFCLECAPTILCCTFSGNSAGQSGGGVYCEGNGANAVIKNCILWNNSAPNGPEIGKTGCTPKVTYCDVKGGYSGTGNINADPQFTSGSQGNYYIKNSSPCIDVGSGPSSGIHLDALTSMDILTTQKTHVCDEGTVDMGFHYKSDIGARFGNVDWVNGSRASILKVNGSQGDVKRVYDAAVGAPLSITMDAPPSGPVPAKFALYVVQFLPGLADMSEQPYSLGTACIPMPPSTHTCLPPPLVFANNIGYWRGLGYPLFSWIPPAPCTIMDLPYGLQAGTYAFQGFIYDYGSAGLGGSLTNAIVLNIQ